MRMLAMSPWPKTRVDEIALGLVLRSGDQTEEELRGGQLYADWRRACCWRRSARGVAAAETLFDHGPGRDRSRWRTC